MFLCWAWLYDTQAQFRSVSDAVSLSEALQTKRDCTFSGSHSCKVPSVAMGKWTEGGRGHFLPCRTGCLVDDGDFSRERSISLGWCFQCSEFIAPPSVQVSRKRAAASLCTVWKIFNVSHFGPDSSVNWPYSSRTREEIAVSASCSVQCVNGQLDWTCQKALKEFCMLPPTH